MHACPHCGNIPDRPEDDATDAAHPAWWRGHDHGATGTAELLLRVVRQGGRGAGQAYKSIATTALAIEALREAAAKARR